MSTSIQEGRSDFRCWRRPTGHRLFALQVPLDTNSDLMARGRCGIAARMNGSVHIVRDMSMTRFGRAVEDVVR